MPPCRFGKARPHNNAARNGREASLPRAKARGGQELFRGLCTRIGLLLCCGTSSGIDSQILLLPGLQNSLGTDQEYNPHAMVGMLLKGELCLYLLRK